MGWYGVNAEMKRKTLGRKIRGWKIGKMRIQGCGIGRLKGGCGEACVNVQTEALKKPAV